MREGVKKGSGDEAYDNPHDRHVVVRSLLPKNLPEFHASSSFSLSPLTTTPLLCFSLSLSL